MKFARISLRDTVLFSAIVALLLCYLGHFPAIRTTFFVFIFDLTGWIIYCSLIYPFLLSPLRHIPTVSGIPFLGNIFQIITSEYGVPHREWHRKYGPIIRYLFPLGLERLSITDDEAIKEVTVRDSYNYIKPLRVQKWMASILGRGVLLVDGSEHVKQRKALMPGFSTFSIRSLAPIFWRKGLLMTRLIQETHFAPNVEVAAPVEMLDWMNRATLDVICDAGFGYKMNSLENPRTPLRRAYDSVFAFDLWSRIIQVLLAQSQTFRYLPSSMNREMENAGNIIRSTANDIVKQNLGRASDNDDHDILSLVVNANKLLKDGDEDYLTFTNIRDQVMTFLGAGHDTTATGVIWTLHLLSKHQDMQDRVRQEIRSALPSLIDFWENPSSVPQIDVDQLPYLNNVCRESLRYIPPVPSTIRETLCDTELGGYVVPKGTILYIMANAINRQEHYWGTDPDRFDPERWDKLPETYTTNAFMTFLHGPRSCIGRKFAEMEMKVFLCCLLSIYRFELDDAWDDQENWKMWRLVLRPRDGMHLKLSRVQVH